MKVNIHFHPKFVINTLMHILQERMPRKQTFKELLREENHLMKILNASKLIILTSLKLHLTQRNFRTKPIGRLERKIRQIHR